MSVTFTRLTPTVHLDMLYWYHVVVCVLDLHFTLIDQDPKWQYRGPCDGSHNNNVLFELCVNRMSLQTWVLVNMRKVSVKYVYPTMYCFISCNFKLFWQVVHASFLVLVNQSWKWYQIWTIFLQVSMTEVLNIGVNMGQCQSRWPFLHGYISTKPPEYDRHTLSHSIRLRWSRKLANSFQWMPLVAWWKNWHWCFFYFLGVICRFSINIWIEEVHFFALIGK